MRRRIVQAVRLAWHIILFMLGACGQTTPLGIHYACESDVSACGVNPDHVDTLATSAARLANLAPSRLYQAWVSVEFAGKPIQVMGETLSGACVETSAQVLYVSEGEYAPHSALLHEFYHMSLYLKTGDYDSSHSAPGWRELESIKQALRGAP